MKSKKQIASDKILQYGLKAMTERELLDVLKYQGSIESYYSTYEYKASKELHERRERPQRIKVTSSHIAASLFTHLQDEEKEQFWVAYTNRNSGLITTEFISKGHASAVIVDVQQIIRSALNNNAQGIVLCHNHPSGNTRPSSQDKTITEQVKTAANVFNITLLDHVIIAGDIHFSFADEGIL
ncbi:MAG: JAB domain-containing protein [Saprospiraceae bacterium]